MFKKRVIGLMSGTSLDGLDICYVQFEKDQKWTFSNIIAETIPYSSEWGEKLGTAIELSRSDLNILNQEFGQYLANKTTEFMAKHNLQGQVDLIASHGHTIHHQPQAGITVQIGDGQIIANQTGLPVIFDFRTADVALGGQGAPLVPMGDEHLFNDYDACLNLGGIANISMNRNGERIAFDITACNLPLNSLTRNELNIEYDANGQIAASGQIIEELLLKLNELSYYNLQHPKSLGVEWLNEIFYPILKNFHSFPLADRLATIIAHETDQIARIFADHQIKNVLVTGGGAFNSYFIQRLQHKTDTEITLPSPLIIDFKEALIFGFLGVLHSRNEINTLRSVTGASRNSIGGRRVEPRQ
jgi:anhydro-N-acetylmuramic acid kinase